MFTQATLAVVMIFGANDLTPEEQLIPIPQGQVIESTVVPSSTTVTGNPCPCPCRRSNRLTRHDVPCLGGWWQWWISPCTMKQHNAYCPTLGGNYYFRPYNIAQLDRQYETVKGWGLDTTNPYDTSFFQTDVYDRLPQEWFPQPEYVEGEETEAAAQEEEAAAPVISTPPGGLVPMPPPAGEVPAEPALPVFTP